MLFNKYAYAKITIIILVVLKICNTIKGQLKRNMVIYNQFKLLIYK